LKGLLMVLHGHVKALNTNLIKLMLVSVWRWNYIRLGAIM
jgi:hypothetical protein